MQTNLLIGAGERAEGGGAGGAGLPPPPVGAPPPQTEAAAKSSCWTTFNHLQINVTMKTSFGAFGSHPGRFHR